MKPREAIFKGDYRADGRCMKVTVEFEWLKEKGTYRVSMIHGVHRRTLTVGGSFKPCPTHATLLLDYWIKNKPLGPHYKIFKQRSTLKIIG